MDFLLGESRAAIFSLCIKEKHKLWFMIISLITIPESKPNTLLNFFLD